MAKTQVLLIAAGESKRMGISKQLLSWGNQTLIEHQIEVLQKAGLSVSVVLGANAKVISKTIEYLGVRMIENKHWREGMGTSIACGVKEVRKSELLENGILIALVDQPLIAPEHFQQMIASFEPGKHQIVVSETSSGFKSPPVLFDAFYLEELMRLEGDSGAKQIIKEYEENVMTVLCESSLEDMDTPEAYQQMLKIANRQS